jgi:hypothetical protein
MRSAGLASRLVTLRYMTVARIASRKMALVTTVPRPQAAVLRRLRKIVAQRGAQRASQDVGDPERQDGLQLQQVVGGRHHGDHGHDQDGRGQVAQPKAHRNQVAGSRAQRESERIRPPTPPNSRSRGSVPWRRSSRGVHNVVLRSNRTEEVANLAATDLVDYARVAPLDDSHLPDGSAAQVLGRLANGPNAILLSTQTAGYLQAQEGDKSLVLLARGKTEQVTVELNMLGTFQRLPGFPDGADALMNLERHAALVTSTSPAFFLVDTIDRSDAAVERVAAALRNGLGASDRLQIDARLTAVLATCAVDKRLTRIP